MSSNVKISVIIPVYNMEQYLAQCLDSVLGQTLRDIEAVCVNDGSKDGSLEILQGYRENDDRVVIIDQPNAGVGKARNNGIDRARGEFVIFMDPDDFYPDDDILEALYNGAKQNNVRICGGSFSELHENGNVRTRWSGLLDSYTFYVDRVMDYSEYQFDFGYHRFIYDRAMLNENDIRFPLYCRFQDPPFMVKAMITAGRFYAMQKVTYRYRWGHQNLKWDERRTYDVLCGLCDDLRMSGEAGLGRLHTITAERLTREFMKPIALNIDSVKIIGKLNETYAMMKPELLQKPYTDERFVLAPIYEEIKRCMGLQAELDALKQQNRNAPQESRRGLLSKIKGGLHCAKTNGIIYTIKLGLKKLPGRKG